MEYDYEFTTNEKAVMEALESTCEAALHAVGLQAEGYAKLRCPVDTGLLRNSITYAIDGQEAAIQQYHGDNPSKYDGRPPESGSYSGTVPKERKNRHVVYIGTNVEYAPYVEYGAELTKAQPFLRPAAAGHTDEYMDIIKEYLKAK
jgi:HK97 gp10 family phage protein